MQRTPVLWRVLSCCAITLLGACAPMPSTTSTAARQLMLIGDEEKFTWDDAGKAIFKAPGHDEVLVVDGKLALVANSLDWVADGAAWKGVPDNKVYVIDLTANPPQLVDTVLVGKQPSGLSISHAGDLALVANRADNSISVLKIAGRSVKVIDTVPMGEVVTHVAIASDGRHAVAAKFNNHKAALLDIDGDKVAACPRGWCSATTAGTSTSATFSTVMYRSSRSSATASSIPAVA